MVASNPNPARPPLTYRPPAGWVYNGNPSKGVSKSPTSSTPPLGGDGLQGLTGAQRDAAVALRDLFTSYGLGSLVPDIVNFIKQGYSADTITILLQDTKAYNERFAANNVRRAKGLPVLSPAEYIATEDAYRQTLQKWGMPSGFYDSTQDFQKFLENDMSPVELDQRAQAASDFMNQADSAQMAYYKQFYTSGDLVAFALDPKRAAPLVGKAFAAARIGGAAQEQGIGIDSGTADSLAGLGVSDQQARSGFSQIAQMQQPLNKLGSIYGDSISQSDLINATFAGDGNTENRIKKLASQERAAFGGTSAISGGSLATNGSND